MNKIIKPDLKFIKTIKHDAHSLALKRISQLKFSCRLLYENNFAGEKMKIYSYG